MDLGISGYRPGMGWLAQALNARWAQFSVNVLDAEAREWEQVPALVEDADRNGCVPILDACGTMDDLARIVTRHNDPAAWADAVTVYIDRTMALLEAEPRIQNLEVWGSADLPVILGGRGPQFDCSTILARVHEEVKAAFPQVRVLSGGYGINADSTFLHWGLAEHAPEGFDVYNMHPFPRPGETLTNTLGLYRQRLDAARTCLDDKCAGQPWASTAFGIPTLEGHPPPEYNMGLHWQLPGGVRAVDYADAADWYVELLSLFEALGFEFVCLLTQDRLRGGLYRSWQDACGLLLPDGKPKPFVQALSLWAQERAPFAGVEEYVTTGTRYQRKPTLTVPPPGGPTGETLEFNDLSDGGALFAPDDVDEAYFPDDDAYDHGTLYKRSDW
jgi:hypothetical protein